MAIRCPNCQISFTPRHIEHVTAKDMDVIAGLMKGLSNKEIGALLGMTARTVKAHIGKLIRVTGARGRNQLVYWFSCELFVIGLRELEIIA